MGTLTFSIAVLLAPVAAGQDASSSRLPVPVSAPRIYSSTKQPLSNEKARNRGPAPNNIVYENGPINGTVDKWEISNGVAVSDTFTVQNNGIVITGMTFGAWLTPGDTLQSVEVSFTSQEFGGTTFFDQTLNFTQSGCSSNALGFSVCTEAATIAPVTLNAGTYWMNLVNATTSGSNSAYWDQNSGVGCQSMGCPSEASQTVVGTVPSESFTLDGGAANQTNTTLSVMPSSPVAGEVVTLTAFVLDLVNENVTIGTVSFFNNNQLLGTVEAVDSATTATLQVRFGPGSYSLTARYNGNRFFLGSESPAQQLVVTGTEPTISTLSVAPDGGNYDFALNVFGFGFSSLGGTAPLSNLTQGGLSLGTFNLAGPGTPAFQPQKSYPTGLAPAALAAGDFNGDGITDLLITSYRKAPTNTFSVLLGNPDGSFQAPLNYPAGSETVGAAVWDFNGDGFADIAIANSAANQVAIRLGNGDGTFQNPLINDTGPGPVQLVVADFDEDGNADLAVTNYNIGNGNTVSILLGDGSGHFSPQHQYTTGAGPYGIAAADFNGDGFLDLAVVNVTDATVSILINQGDGSFQQTQAIQVGGVPIGIAAGDFNGDGNVDLAVTDYGPNGTGNTVKILLGNGNGTFQAAQEYSTGTGPYGIAVASFNPNGILDLVTANQTDNTVTVLPGNGDGSFGQPIVYPVGSEPLFVVAADFNGDGGADIAVSNYDSGAGNNLSVLLGGMTVNGQLNNIQVCGFGNQEIQSDFAPNGTFYAGGLSNILSVQGCGLVPTTTTVASTPNPSTYSQSVTFTAMIAAVGGGSPSGTVTFTSGTTTLCAQVPVVPGQPVTATCSTAVLTGGADTVEACYSGDGVFAPSCGSEMQVVNRAPSTLTGVPEPNPSPYGQSVVITATVGSAVPQPRRGPPLPSALSPTGTVSFSDDFNGTQTGLCQNVTVGTSGLATCTVQNLAVGTHAGITVSYSGDQNYLGNTQLVTPPEVITAAGDFMVLPISPASAQVIQTFNNNDEPFFAHAIDVTVQPVGGYRGSVTLSCSVSPPLAGGSCAVNTPASGSLAGGALNTTLTISAGSTTPPGSYTVTLQAQDVDGLAHSATLALSVIDLAPGLRMPSGGVGGPTPTIYGGSPGTTINNFNCTLVTGTGINGSEDLGAIGGSCSFNPTSTTLPTPVMVTITGCTIAQLRTEMRWYASLWLGLPGIVFLGSVGKCRYTGSKVLRIVATILALAIVLLAVGCGGGSGQTTPSGSYMVLVQGAGSDGAVYSAVVPVTVTKLGQ